MTDPQQVKSQIKEGVFIYPKGNYDEMKYFMYLHLAHKALCITQIYLFRLTSSPTLYQTFMIFSKKNIKYNIQFVIGWNKLNRSDLTQFLIRRKSKARSHIR